MSNIFKPQRKLKGIHATLPSGANGGYLLGRTSTGEGPVEILSVPWLQRQMRTGSRSPIKGLGTPGGIPYFYDEYTEESSGLLAKDSIVLGGGLNPDSGGWDSGHAGGMTVSADTTTATGTEHVAATCRSLTMGGRHTGKWYCKLSIIGNLGMGAVFDYMLGVINASGALNTYCGASNNGAGYSTNGDIKFWKNGSQTQGYTAGAMYADTYAILAVDLDNNLMWIWLSNWGAWSSIYNAEGNPSTGLGGFDISSVNDGSEVFLAFSIFATVPDAMASTQCVIDVEATSADTKLAGFTHWGAGGQYGLAPYTEGDWRIPYNNHIMIGSKNSQDIFSLPAGPTGTMMQVVQADGTDSRVLIDAYAAKPRLTLRRSDTTAAAPSAVQTNDVIGEVGAIGYAASAFSTDVRAAVQMVAGENWDGTHNGTNIVVKTTPTGGSTTPAIVATFQNTGVKILGTTTNDDAAAGDYGEQSTTLKLIANEVSLTTATAANVTSHSFGAGDWDIWGEVWLDLDATTTVSDLAVGLSQTTATLPTVPAESTALTQSFPANTTGSKLVQMVGPARAKLSGSTTYYLVVQATFATSTCKAYGKIYARRVR